MMPHMSRWLVGADHRWSLPVTLLATPALLLFADVLGRLLVPGELRVSVVSAFIGAPVLICWCAVSRAEVQYDRPSRRLLLSCLLLLAASLLVSLWGLGSGLCR
ncbi:Ferric enterobactin transport system permease protein fepD [Raoultella ornithinolytica]|nr:Ferric enterobactin transport system permease protein fepD [Raoultella ornithinolytica]